MNRLREYKRLLSNMLFPVLSVVLCLGWFGYKFLFSFLPILKDTFTVNERLFWIVQILLILVSIFAFTGEKKALIILKPMTLLLFGEEDKRKFIRMKYLLHMIKHVLIAVFLTLCIRGINWNMGFLQTVVLLYSYLEITSMLRWELYHKNEMRGSWKFVFLWGIATGIFIVAHFISEITAMNVVFVIMLYFHCFYRIHINWMKYEDEMRFEEKILSAQNYNQMVLLNSYAKEKKLRNIKGRKKLSKIGSKYPLLWKSAVSVFRLNKGIIIAGILIFGITFTIYKFPIFWSIPVLNQPEIRYLLLLFGMMAVYQLSIQSMIRQMDDVLEKSREGLFLPLNNKEILIQFTVFPFLIVITLSLFLGALLHTGFVELLITVIGMGGLVCCIFYLELTHKGYLQKIYFLFSVAILSMTILLT